ncbi:MAG: hypothetical protein WC805_01895 [Patescibacteria group bacterium]|jgi:hypothetical protein
MTKNKLFGWILIIAAAAALWYWAKAGFPSPAPITNQTSQSGNVLPTSQGTFGSSEIASLLKEAADEQASASAEVGETALIKYIGQAVSDLNQSYEESKF